MKYLAILLLLLPAPKKSEFVAISCVEQLTIHSWGNCKKDGEKWDCEAAHVSFVQGCVSVKPGEGKATKRVTYPSMIAPGQNPEIDSLRPELCMRSGVTGKLEGDCANSSQNANERSHKSYDTQGACKSGMACDIIAPSGAQDVTPPSSQDFKKDAFPEEQ